jgi:hypothetical protein
MTVRNSIYLLRWKKKSRESSVRLTDGGYFYNKDYIQPYFKPLSASIFNSNHPSMRHVQMHFSSSYAISSDPHSFTVCQRNGNPSSKDGSRANSWNVVYGLYKRTTPNTISTNTRTYYSAVTRYRKRLWAGGRRAGESGFDSRQETILLTTASRPVLGPAQPPAQQVPGALSAE